MEKTQIRKQPADTRQKRLAKGNTNDIVKELRIKFPDMAARPAMEANGEWSLESGDRAGCGHRTDDAICHEPKSVQRRDHTNKSALHYCCGQLDLVAAASVTVAAPELLESADEDGFTPLHLAVIQGNMPLVNLLLANKANVDALDNEGHSVIHWATVCAEVEALRALLAAGADISKTDINGGSPLHYAAQMSSGSAFRSQTPILALEILDILLQQPNVQVDVCDRDGRQPLLWAASAGAVKAILMLIKAGARVECSDKDGLTALHCAASRGHTECIDILITLCGAPTDLIDSNGCTALHYAVTLGHADATRLLLDLGADPNRQDRKGRTPAHCGCAKGQFETVKMLRDRRANMWLRNAKGDLPLHEAAASGRRELIQWLLDQRPKQVNTPSNDGRTILHIAAGNDYADVCKLLIDSGADVNSIHRGAGNVVQTPLDCALQKGYRSTAKFLQLHGGLPSSKLHLSGRKPNALNDQELVKPLLYTDKDSNEEANTKKTGNVLLFMNRSDSESNATASDGNDNEDDCSRKCKRLSKRACNCHHDHCHHYYRRHRCRRRTSSCEMIEIHHKNSENRSKPMCRSKSNVEICRYRRSSGRRTKSRRDSSASSYSDDDGHQDSSSESCCEHMRHVKRRCNHHHRSSSKKDSRNKTDDAQSTSKKEQKGDVPTKSKSSKAVKIASESAKKSSTGEKKNQRAPVKNDGRKEKKRPQSASASKGTSEDKEKDKGTVSPANDGDGIHKSSDVLPPNSASTEPSKHDATNTMESSTIATEAMAVADVDKSATEQKTANEKTIVTKADVHTPQQPQQQQVEQQETKATQPSQSASNINVVKTDEKVQQQSGEAGEQQNDATAADMASMQLAANDGSSIVNDMPDIKVTPVVPEQVKSNSEEKKEAPSVPDKQLVEEKSDTRDEKPTTIENTKTDSTKETSNVDPDKNEKEASETPAPVENAPQQVTATEQTTETPTTAPSTAAGPAVSFQVIPESTDSNATLQQTLNVKSAVPPPDTPARKTSFTVLKSDESVEEVVGQDGKHRMVKVVSEKGSARPKSFKILRSFEAACDDDDGGAAANEAENENDDDDDVNVGGSNGGGDYSDSELIKSGGIAIKRRKRLKKRAKSSIKQIFATESGPGSLHRQHSKDHDSGFEPSPRAMRSTKTSRAVYTALPERTRPDVPDGRTCSSRLEKRKPGDKKSVNMTTVSQSIQRNIRRYYMEHKIFQHLLELKSLQIRSNKVNEAVLVKRAVDDYHKSTMLIGAETGGSMRRYPYKEYTFKNFEIFLYEVLKSLQKSGTNNFQNISDVYLEAERRLSPNYSRCKNALYCTTKTHRCLHAAHAYTGIPCAAYIPMMNHHTIPKYGFGRSATGSFFLPKICNKGGKLDQDDGEGGQTTTPGNTVSLELCHGNNKQLITLPAEKLDNNKRYYVTFTLKDDELNAKRDITSLPPSIALCKGQK